eukprot:COSAG01_NODE_9832_length_2328_cov_47.608793_1_plen_104_part_00
MAACLLCDYLQLATSKPNASPPWDDYATKVMACANDPAQAYVVNLKNARATNSLVPAHTGTPWVTVNGVQSNPGDLTELVCKAYKGSAPLPTACGKFRRPNPQ